MVLWFYIYVYRNERPFYALLRTLVRGDQAADKATLSPIAFQTAISHADKVGAALRECHLTSLSNIFNKLGVLLQLGGDNTHHHPLIARCDAGLEGLVGSVLSKTAPEGPARF